MPTYEYECLNPDKDKNHGEFEEFHSIKAEVNFCPHCEKEGMPNIPVKKLISGRIS